MKTSVFPKLCLCVALLSAGLANAHAATMSFTAAIDQFFSLGPANAQLEASFPIGSIVRGSLSYEASSQPIDAGADESGAYADYAGNDFSIEFGEFMASAQGHDISVIDGAYAGWDQLVHFADVDNGVSSSGSVLPVYSISFGLFDETGTKFSNTLLPSAIIQVSDFSSSMFQIVFANDVSDLGLGSYMALGTISAIEFSENAKVPEPSTLALLGLGLVGVAAMRRSRDGKSPV